MVKKNESELSLGWMLFWFIVIPPIGYVLLFLEWWSSDKCIVREG